MLSPVDAAAEGTGASVSLDPLQDPPFTTSEVSPAEQQQQHAVYPTREAYVQACADKHEAPIAEAYTRMVLSRVSYWRHVGDARGNASTSDQEKPAARLEANKRQVRQERQNKLCTHVARGDTCQFGDRCKFAHDVDAFLKAKAEDLPGPCPFSCGADDPAATTETATCPYGYACRYYSAHGDGKQGVLVGAGANGLPVWPSAPGDMPLRADDDTRFWMDDGTVPTEGIPVVVDVGRRVLRPMNDLPVDVRKALRARLYDFSPAMEALQRLGINDMKKKASKRESRDGGREGTKRPAEGCIEDGAKREKRKATVFDARGKTYLAPLTTLGNLPFRRVCKRLGADVTCGEMAMSLNLIQGQPSEWALLKRHPEEDFFGVQICGAHPDTMTYCAQLIEEHCDVDFVDINCGCPIDCVVKKGAGSACLTHPNRLEKIIRGISSVLTCPITIKMRRGFDDGHDVAHTLIPKLGSWGASAAVLHGRTRQQRYSKPADWDYIKEAARINAESTDSACQVIGNGDVYGWQDHERALASGDIATTYVARGALIKPWIFTEIKEKRDWDISASERLDIIRQYVRNGLEHWGSDAQGVETTRRFLLEWLSFTCRYIPAGLLEVLPQKSNWRPTAFVGRNDLETLLASPDPADWIRISELFLGNVPPEYKFQAKHAAKSYEQTRVDAPKR